MQLNNDFEHKRHLRPPK